jgi:UDP-2-acetamido-3-amino-2,3-dideoxy-glucuronate N-acetyltransferase
VRNFAALGALHTICDIDPTIIEGYHAQYPEIKVCNDYRQVLQDEAVRGVVIAAPAILHYPMARTALLAGKDVFVEKPLALNVEQGYELVGWPMKHGRILMVGHLLGIPSGHS